VRSERHVEREKKAKRVRDPRDREGRPEGDQRQGDDQNPRKRIFWPMSPATKQMSPGSVRVVRHQIVLWSQAVVVDLSQRAFPQFLPDVQVG
jgi:hypothetical protein